MTEDRDPIADDVTAFREAERARLTADRERLRKAQSARFGRIAFQVGLVPALMFGLSILLRPG